MLSFHILHRSAHSDAMITSEVTQLFKDMDTSKLNCMNSPRLLGYCQLISLSTPTPPPNTHTNEDGSVSFKEFTKYMAQLSLMESRTETPDSDYTEVDFPLLPNTGTLTTPGLSRVLKATYFIIICNLAAILHSMGCVIAWYITIAA